LPPILHTNLSDINITVPTSIDINMIYSDAEGSPLTNMTLLNTPRGNIRLVRGNLLLIHTSFLTPCSYYKDLQL